MSGDKMYAVSSSDVHISSEYTENVSMHLMYSYVLITIVLLHISGFLPSLINWVVFVLVSFL